MNKQTIITLGIGVAVIVASLSLWYVYQRFFTFSLVSATPGNNHAISTATPAIRLTFSKDIEPTTFKASFSPAVSINNIEIDKNNIYINIDSNFTDTTTYVLSLSGIQSKDGKKMNDTKLTYNASSKTPLSEEERAIILNRQDKAPEKPTDPVLTSTPLRGDAYVVESFVDASPTGEPKITVVATVTIPPGKGNPNALTPEQEAAASNAKKQIAKDFTDKHQIDMSKYTVLYRLKPAQATGGW